MKTAGYVGNLLPDGNLSVDMVRTLTISLRPTAEQAKALLETIEAFNAACSYASRIAWESRTFRNYDLRKRCYYELRARFGLPAQLAQHAIKKVADAYKVSKAKPAAFRPHGAVTYDRRVMRLEGVSNVSMTLLPGREKVRLAVGRYHFERFRGATVGEADLVYLAEKHCFRLHFSLRCEAPPLTEGQEVLGVDLGIANLAVDSDGHRYSGAPVNRLRHRHRRLRARLSAKWTNASRRLYRKRRRKERRFATWVNHHISKQLVAEAAGTGRAIALEELGGIRDRITVRRPQRATHASWSFHQLRSFIEYKAVEAGVLVILVDPRNTSRRCPRCGHCERANRPSQEQFRCRKCSLAGHADYIAAQGLRILGWAAL
jgi:putative transposase